MKAFILMLFIPIMVFSGTKSWALMPARQYKHLPSDFNMEFQEDTITTNDGAEIMAWYFKNDHYTQRTLIICHNGQGNMGDYLDRVDQFMNLEYNVVIFDYRGFGNSSPFGISAATYIYPEFVTDLKAVIDHYSKGTIYPIVLYGWGMGGSLALGVGFQEKKVDYIISDSPFLTAKGLEDKLMKAGAPAQPALHGFPKQYQPYYVLDMPANKAMKGVLLLVNDNEKLNPSKDLALLKAKKPTLVKLSVLPTNNNPTGYDADTPEYFKRVADFLKSSY